MKRMVQKKSTTMNLDKLGGTDMTSQRIQPDRSEGIGTGFVRRSLRIFSIILLAILVIIVVAVVGLYVYEPLPADGFAFSSAGKTMQLSDGRALAYLEIGNPEGRPVFYFHGGPGSHLEGRLYDELNRRLGIRMIAINRPGYGLSDVQKDRTYLDWPDDVRELADHLDIERFAVLGWSSGGPYAASVAYGIPERLTVAAIVSGEGPYASDDYPQSVLTSATFNGSGFNKLLIWSAHHGPWLMRTLFRVQRLVLFRDPAGMVENAGDVDMGFEVPAKDLQFFTRREYSVVQVEAFRQGVEGMTRDFTIERLAWPFRLEEIHHPEVLVFHGEEDTAIHPKISEYVCSRIPSCNEPTIYPGEGHSVVYHRYEEIVRAMLEAWE
jgi:pimeloyl-ACP methyl ester carboxylesterase